MLNVKKEKLYESLCGQQDCITRKQLIDIIKSFDLPIKNEVSYFVIL